MLALARSDVQNGGRCAKLATKPTEEVAAGGQSLMRQPQARRAASSEQVMVSGPSLFERRTGHAGPDMRLPTARTVDLEPMFLANRTCRRALVRKRIFSSSHPAEASELEC
eukprot:TRINITY_DN79304_c0_g1_i1.p1 TRINITY_DN79304_c0_g1~~TRINITY_DN79304_c0_g1_i1.p1  ORF type:complete len:111 (-),score=5.29 TRINITY_DN79304_c0_g1_i1:34-366(-)